MLRVLLSTVLLAAFIACLFYYSKVSLTDIPPAILFWWKTLVLGCLLSALLGMTGFWLMARQALFTGLSLSAAAGFGVLLAAATLDRITFAGDHSEWHIYPLALCMAVALKLFMRLCFANSFGESAATAITYLFATAGLVLLSDMVKEGHHEAGNLLFGNAVTVLEDDWHITLPLACILIVLGLKIRKKAVAFCFDPVHFKLVFQKSLRTNLMLQGFILVTLIIASKIMGVLATFSIALFSSLSAQNQARSAKSTFLISTWYGFLLFPAGFSISFFLDLPTGACIALAGFVLMINSVLVVHILR